LTQTDEIDGVECFHSIPELLENLRNTVSSDEEVFVI
jgi:hypothetical protein